MKWTWLFVVNFYCTVAAAQQYHFKLFNTQNGLSNNNVTCLAKDKKGFLWVGTNNGLNRFDGSAFDNFFYNPNDSTTIQNNQIQDILVTKNNDLWVSTINGISLFDEISQSFKNYSPDTSVLSKIGYGFPKLYQTEDNNLWVGTWYDLLLFDIKTKTFTSSGWAKYAATLHIKNANNTRVLVQSIAAKSTTELWILSTYGLFSVNIFTKQFTFYENSYINDYYGCTIGCVDDKNNVYINTYNKGLVCFNSTNKNWQHYNTPIIKPTILNTIANQVSGINNFNSNTLLYCSNKNIFLFDAEKNKTISTLLIENTEPEKKLPANYNGLLKDSNTLWVQSSKGLVKLYPSTPLFEEQIISNTQYLGHCFFTEKNNEFIMHDGDKAIFYYNKLNHTKSFINTSNHLPLKDELSYYIKTKNDTSYFTTENAFYSLTHNLAINIPLPKKLVEQNPYTTRNIVSDNKGNLYIRCRKQGVVKYNINTKTASFLNSIPSDANNEYSALFFDSTTNNLWIGLQNKGVYLFNTITKSITHHLLNTAPSKRGGIIYCITKSPQGVIYLSDMYNGLLAYNNNTGSFSRFTNYEGLASNNCLWLSMYHENLWIGNSAGISLMNTKTGLFKNFKIPEGSDYLSDYFITDSLGNSYHSSGNKFMSWNISNFIAAPQKGKLYLRQCKLFNTVLPEQTHYYFKYDENNLQFTIGYLMLNNDNVIAFEYKLNNGNWIAIGTDNKISFANLSSNNYALQVRLKNDTEQILQISFTIEQPFYKTWWFILLLAMFIATLIYIIFKRRINTIRQQASLKQKIAETEMMALKAQMNPHFIFNCISSIDNFILDNDATNASAYLNKFAKLIRNILDNSIHEVVPFWKDWETLSYYVDLEKLRSNDQFVCVMEADEILLNGHYKIPPLIIQPYVENAIHHGLKPLQHKSGILQIHATLQNGLLIYTVKDNGVGRNADQNNMVRNATSHTSYGMALTEQRINLFNAKYKHAVTIADLKDDGGNNSGTLITIILNV
jgi:ligand-binding sensor domain-containing protein